MGFAVLVNFPLFLIAFAIYNMIVFITPGVSWGDEILSIPMQSGATWIISLGDALIALSLVFLLVEVLKATRNSVHSMFDHLLSTVIFIAALVEFLLVPQAATSVFAILLIMALVDLLAGWSVSLRAARRDLTVESMPNDLV